MSSDLVRLSEVCESNEITTHRQVGLIMAIAATDVQRNPRVGMLAIVRNAWIDETRSRHRRDAVLVPENEAVEVGDTGTDRDIEWWSIQSALGRLPEEQRLAVALVLIEGLSYREAAQVMEVPIGTLTSRLARGRLALQAMLTDPSITRVARKD